MGDALFAFAAQMVGSATFQEEAEVPCKNFFEQQVTLEGAAALQRKLEECATINEAALMSKREIKLSFLGYEFTTVVTSPTLEWELRYKCKLKEHALGKKNGLAMLLYEKWIFKDPVNRSAMCQRSWSREWLQLDLALEISSRTTPSTVWRR